MEVGNYYSRARAWPSKLNVKQNSKILDIGCGTGVLGRFLKHQFNASVTGIEVLPECANIARESLEKVFCEDIEKTNILSKLRNFDHVIFSDSLEHLVEPDLVLQKIVSVMSSGDSSVLISIPNVRNFRVLGPLVFRGDWKYESEGLLDRTHLRFFTKKSICRTLHENGFEVKNIKCELPLTSLSGKLNLLTLGLFEGFLTSHYYVEACKRKS